MRHVLLAAAILAAGCATAPRTTQPKLDVQPPEQWAAARVDSGETAPDWWRSFGDDALDEVVETALENNLDLRAAAARVDQAAAQARIAGADLWPQLNAGASGSRTKRNFIGFPIPGGEPGEVRSSTSTTLGLSLNVSWELDVWGRLGARSRAGLADLQASEADFAAARLSLAGQAAKSWFAVAEASQQVALATAQVRSFRSTARQVRERYDLGLRPALDLRLALANLSGAEASLKAREEQLDVLTRQLETMLGRYPDRQQEVARELPDTPPAVPVGLPAHLISRRPDLVAAERRLAAADARFAAARRDRYPRLSLTASGGTSTEELGDLLDGDFSVWSLIGNLVQPLFQGGRLKAGVELAKGSSAESLARYASLVLGAYREVETALAAEHLLADQERHLADAAGQSRAAERLADDRYREGLADFITVLESQRRAFQADSAWISARRLRLDNRIDLFLALGGGFERNGHAATEAQSTRRTDSTDPAGRATKMDGEGASR